jgi:hypothetical protein
MKSARTLRIAGVCLAAAILGCSAANSILLQRDPPTRTETVAAVFRRTQIPTAEPKPALTRRPSGTPTVACVPPLGSAEMQAVQAEADSLIPGGTVIWFDDFTCSELGYGWGYGRENPNTRVSVSDGVLTFTTKAAGDVWDGVIRNDRNIQDRTGFLVLFRFAAGTSANLFATSGDWQADNFRRWGLEFRWDPAFHAEWNLWQGKNSTPWAVSGIALTPGTWYYLLVRIDENAGVGLKVWPKENPEETAEFQRTMDSSWKGRRWGTLFQVYDGTLELDRYWEAAFVG